MLGQYEAERLTSNSVLCPVFEIEDLEFDFRKRCQLWLRWKNAADTSLNIGANRAEER
jgi:hypothetical protein